MLSIVQEIFILTQKTLLVDGIQTPFKLLWVGIINHMEVSQSQLDPVS